MNADIEWDVAYCDVMGRKYASSQLSNIEVLGIGAAVLDWAATVRRIGHASPASTLDYTGGLDSLSALIVRDFVAWTCGRLNTVPGDPKQRLMDLIDEAEWDDVVIEKVCRIMRGVAA